MPGGTAAVDECGVCNGGNAAKGCDGVCFSGAVTDECGQCGGNNALKGCDGVCRSGKVADACGVCGGGVTDVKSCDVGKKDCVLVPATPEIKKFQSRLVFEAKKLYKRFGEEAGRASKYRCKIDTKKPMNAVKSAYGTIVSEGRAIFNEGVEVCGDSCVTFSYEGQVKGLIPYFKVIEKETVKVANAVKACIGRRPAGKPPTTSVKQTVQDVRTGLNKLVKDCSKVKRCPPR